MESKTKLKHCPFCGGKPNIYEGEDFTYIWCLECGCRTPGIDVSIKYCAIERVAELWNERFNK